ncbi:Signal transduction histidine kinase [Ekhidna lutea]|uniref:histidine kinase n=1 Tax=Ekhidna lutea TaxID=447679 RepID=A0A239IRJ7_EKHLU|nr:HAMP domain-containing sensor histidine kinase [Ekhidna lutea]SNS95044.1 Signal transduction histidine kinase [Ekhidna lutea]
MTKKANRVREVILRRSTLIIFFILILGAFGLLRVVTTHKDIDDVANIDLPLIEVLTQIETYQLEQAINFERAIRYAEEIEPGNDIALQGFAMADSTFRYMAELVDILLVDAEHQVSEALKITNQEAQRIKLKGLLLSIKKLESDHTSYENHALEVVDLLEEGRLEEAVFASERVEHEEDQFNKQVEGVLMRHEMFTEALVKIVEQEEVLSMKWIVTLTLLFIILSLLAVYTFSYKIWRPLEDIRSGAEKIEAGNLNARIKLSSNSITSDIVDSFNSMAERLSYSQKEIDQFIHFSYSTADDLKAPITNLGSLLDMLGKDNVNASNFKAILNNARKTNQQLEKTVNSLVEVNKVREELSSEKDYLNIDEVLKEVVATSVAKIKNANATIKKDFSECTHISYPKTQLKAIFKHLLLNSLTYRDPEKALQIRIKSKQKNGHTTIIFKDNGLGFDSIKHKEEIFKPYTRLHSHVDGSGLGLYIIKMIVDYHRGGIRVESESRRGATFALRLD